MAAAVATPVVGNLHDPEYVNWLKSNRALHRTIEVLRDVCMTEMQTFYNSLLTQHGSTTCSKPCTHSDINGKRGSWSIRCPSTTKVCCNWLADILRERTQKSTRLNWQNSDHSQWQTQPWQIAKVYMDRQDIACINPTETDVSGILQLLLNCKRFKNLMDTTKVDAVREVRNSLMHSTTMKVTDIDLITHMQTMVKLLEDPLQLLQDPAAKQAVTDIKQIKTTALGVNETELLEQERYIWKDLIFGLSKDNKWKEILKLTSSNPALQSRLQVVVEDFKKMEKRVGVLETTVKSQDEKIGEVETQVTDQGKRQDEKIGEVETQVTDQGKRQDEKIGEVQTQAPQM